jgi:penicillin-binding protein 2
MLWGKRNIEYKVPVDDDEWVTPEETLVDIQSQHSHIEMPIVGPVFRFLLILFLSSFAIILSFVFKMSVLEYDHFANLAFQNRSSNFPIPPARGLIFDRLGKPITRNVPNFDLLVVSNKLGGDSSDVISSVANIINKDSDIFLNKVMDEAQRRSIFYAARDLTKDEALNIQYLNPSGFHIISNSKRKYISGSKFSQIIGYVGKVSKDDLDNDSYYFPTDTVGRLGVEAEYEYILRGKHGNISFTDEKYSEISREPTAGQNIVLNIDFDLQKILHDELWQVLREANLPKAAAVIQNPNNGAVLAMASFPTFDNNIFSSEVSEDDYVKLFENKYKPLFNRMTSGQYNPGSTIKPFIAMAALQERIVRPEDNIKDCVSITIDNPYNPDVSYTFRNWRDEFGYFNLKKAIANSCNIYFFTVAGGYGNIEGIGIRKLAQYLSGSFADILLGIDLPGEVNGFVPTPEWKEREKGESWYLGDTYNISIGQGDLLVTPLWLNSYVSAIANGGTLYKPRVANRIVDIDMKAVKVFQPKKIGELPFGEWEINEIKAAMHETTISGTAKVMSYLPVKSAAKTGTAEVAKNRTTNSLFIAFAPLDNPELAITVLVEDSPADEGLAARAAYNILKRYFDDN